MDVVSNVICAYCMKNVSTYEGWEKIYYDVGIRHLNTLNYSMDFQGISGMIRDEGIVNSIFIMYKYVTKKQVRNRMNRMNKFFTANPEYFGYGIYIAHK